MSNYEWYRVDRPNDPASKWCTFTRPTRTTVAPFLWHLTMPDDGRGKVVLVLGIRDATSAIFRWVPMAVYDDVGHAKRGADKVFLFLRHEAMPKELAMVYGLVKEDGIVR